MKILIVYAHPKTVGFCSAILDRILSELKNANILSEVIDLYSINYDPILKSKEHYTSGNKEVSSQNKDFQQKISDCDRLIIIYPVWWNGPPAILKGFFDRVLTPGFAYRFNKGIPEKLIKKRCSVFLTHGGPDFFTTFILQDRGAKIVTKDTLGFCGIKTKFFKLGNCRRFDKKADEKIQKLVEKGVKYLLH
jgi:NAD(P)H dehydrogenase (quinone)